MPNIPEEDFRNMLEASGYVSKKDIDKAFKQAQGTNRDPADILLGDELITEDVLTKILADYFRIPFLELKKDKVDPTALSSFPEELARKYRAVVLKKGTTSIEVGMVDPSDLQAIKFLTDYFKLPVDTRMITKAGLNEALSLYKTSLVKDFSSIITENVDKARNRALGEKEGAKDAPIIKILNTILDYAAQSGASDIHFEPEEQTLLVRFRVDGVMHDTVELPSSLSPAVVSRIKILANLKIDEHRLPQEGRFKYQSPDQKLTMRVSIIPTGYGERAEMRLLVENVRPYSLSELGLTERDKNSLEQEAKKPFGMILITGPTGSGKTTTLYALIYMLNDPKVNIVTVEDPIEYTIPHISQMQINEDIGLTFDAGLKAFLRQDPNIIMIGEIRYSETAKTSVNAALTGHLLLSTLHTNDAASSIARLIDLGVEPFLLASTLRAVVGQRLVRKLCQRCVKSVSLEATPATVQLIRELAVDNDVALSLIPRTIYRAQGCSECTDGYKGRSGIYEVMRITPGVADMILTRKSSAEIKKMARKQGMSTMLEDGLRKVQIGLTSLEEVIKVIKE